MCVSEADDVSEKPVRVLSGVLETVADLSEEMERVRFESDAVAEWSSVMETDRVRAAEMVGVRLERVFEGVAVRSGVPDTVCVLSGDAE